MFAYKQKKVFLGIQTIQYFVDAPFFGELSFLQTISSSIRLEALQDCLDFVLWIIVLLEVVLVP